MSSAVLCQRVVQCGDILLQAQVRLQLLMQDGTFLISQPPQVHHYMCCGVGVFYPVVVGVPVGSGPLLWLAANEVGDIEWSYLSA